MQRVEAAKPRIESLNPLVAVDVVSDPDVLANDAALEALVSTVDLVILTDAKSETAVRFVLFATRSADAALQLRVNACTRHLNKPFYAGGSYGLTGYVFVDLLSHEYVATCALSLAHA